MSDDVKIIRSEIINPEISVLVNPLRFELMIQLTLYESQTPVEVCLLIDANTVRKMAEHLPPAPEELVY